MMWSRVNAASDSCLKMGSFDSTLSDTADSACDQDDVAAQLFSELDTDLMKSESVPLLPTCSLSDILLRTKPQKACSKTVGNQKQPNGHSSSSPTDDLVVSRNVHVFASSHSPIVDAANSSSKSKMDCFSIPLNPSKLSSKTKTPPSRNAMLARKNREKKKAAFNDLKQMVQKLTTENDVLKSEQSKLKSTINELTSKVEYLNAVLKNDSHLANVLKLVATIPHINESKKIIHPSVFASAQDQHSYCKQTASGGLCLHVSRGNVSFEMCHQCNANHVEKN